MSLQIWLPLNGNLKNMGCGEVQVTGGTAQYLDTGKLGKCANLASRVIFYSSALANMTNENFSVAFWVRTDPSSTLTGDWVDIMGMQDLNTNKTGTGTFRFEACYSSNLRACSWHDSTNNNIISGSFTCVPDSEKGKWHHVCVTMSNGSSVTYRDGVNIGTATTVAGGYFNGILHIGETNAIAGGIADLRIYNHCLSVAEVKEIAKGLVCHYKLSSDGNDNLLKYTHVNATNKNLLKTNINSRWNNLPITTIDGHDCYQYPTAQSPTWFSSGYWFEPMEANTTYTYTAWIYFTANANFNFSSLGHFQVYNSNSTASDKSHEDIVASRIYEPSTIKANTWTKIRITFTTNSLAGSRFQLYPRYNIAANTGELYFRDCKLEKNCNPTEWVPNSADIEYSGMGYDSTTVIDCSGYGYNGTKSGTLSRYNGSPRYDSSTTFVDSNSSVTVTPYLSDGQKVYSISVSCWFRTNTMNGGLPNLWSLGENSFLRIRLASATSIWYYVRVGSTMVGLTYAAGKTLTDNTWHHVVLTFLNGVFVVYLDGVQIGTTDSSSTATYLTCASVGATWHLAGYTATSESFVGQLSDFRIYTSCLSANDVKALYNTGARIAKTGAMLSYEVKEEG